MDCFVCSDEYGYETAFHVLLRPDNHVGYIGSISSIDELTSYLESHVSGFQRERQ